MQNHMQTTSKDWNTHAELHHDLANWNNWDDNVEEIPMADKIQELWHGSGHVGYMRHITLADVFEQVLEKYDPDGEYDEHMLEHAMEYPESVWFQRLVDESIDMIEENE